MSNDNNENKEKPKQVLINEDTLQTMMTRLHVLEDKVNETSGSPIVTKAVKDHTVRIIKYQPRGEETIKYLSSFDGVNYFLPGRKDNRGRPLEFVDIKVTTGKTDKNGNLIEESIKELVYADFIQTSVRVKVKVLDTDVDEIEEGGDEMIDAKEVPEGKYHTVNKGYRVPAINIIKKIKYKLRLPNNSHVWFDESAINA